jgi:uncharacterized coiled-coil protein SlyX
MTIDITPEAVSRYRGTIDQLINALEATPIRGGINGQVVAHAASIAIRALSDALTASQASAQKTVDHLAALLLASQAETAAAYAVAAHTLDKWATNLRDINFPDTAPVVEQCSAMIRALTPADSKAALDRMIAEAEERGMRKPSHWMPCPPKPDAETLAPFKEGTPHE